MQSGTLPHRRVVDDRSSAYTEPLQGIDLPTVLLIAVFSGGAGHALAQPFENTLGRWLAVPAWHDEDARTFCLQVEPVEFPEWLWWQGGQGFIVRRIPEEETPKD